MEITVLEELKILNGTVGPGSEENKILLLDLVHQIAMGEGIELHTNYKVFPTQDEAGEPINTEAQSYLTKVLGVISSVYSVNSQTVNSLKKLVVSLIGNSDKTWTEVQAASDKQWADFITDNMLRTFELLGRVLKSEKAAYDNLP